jgi:hypothetical protein
LISERSEGRRSMNGYRGSRWLSAAALLPLFGCPHSVTVVDSRYYDVTREFGRRPRVPNSVTVVHSGDDVLLNTARRSPIERASADGEAARVCMELMRDMKKAGPRLPASKIRIAEDALPELTGAKYEKALATTLAREKNAHVHSAFKRLMGAVREKRTPEAKIDLLAGEAGVFEGTVFEKKIDQMIETQRRRLPRGGQPSPDDGGAPGDACSDDAGWAHGDDYPTGGDLARASLAAATPVPEVHVVRRRASSGQLLSAGPRFGLVHVTGDLALSLEYEHGAKPPLTAWGWQFEYQHETSVGGPTGLVEFVPFVAGLEQGLSLYSLSVFAGLRTVGGSEFVIGPYVSPNGVGLGVAVGHTFRKGDLNLPVNLSLTNNNHGARCAVTIGWNLRQQ